MADPKASNPSARLDALSAALEQKLTNEQGILDLLVAAHARGQAIDAQWDRFHEAAQRDERLAELAFAYERFTGERRVKLMPAAVQAKLLHRAGVFFADIFSDAGGAEGYLERALALAPTDQVIFERLETLLVGRHEGLKLADLYAASAAQRGTKDEQLELLRRAAELFESFAGADAKAIKLYQDILKLEPNDVGARKSLADRYAAAGRNADLARLLEQWLVGESAATGDAALDLRSRLVGLYAGKLGEIERALPHAEEILRVDATNEPARVVAERLLAHKGIAVRVATLLEGVHERLGNPGEAARMLGVEIDVLRGPKRAEAQKRLADLYGRFPDELGDRAKALALHEAVVLLDPGDDAVRGRYLALAAELDKRADVIRVLPRAANGSKDGAARARIHVDLANVFVSMGDPKRARAAFASVLDQPADRSEAGDAAAVLAAARGLDAILTELKDAQALRSVLQRLSEIEIDDDRRVDATERLAKLSEELRDPAGAIAAYRGLVDSPREAGALLALERLLEASGAQAELAVVLRRRAARATDRAEARQLSLRAAEIRTKLGDRGAALEAWRAFVEAFGPSREAFARLIPLLEQERAWDELARAFEADAALAPDAERGALFGRLGQLRATRLGDPTGALEAYARALAIEPAERTSRAAVERLLQAGDQRLAAADILDPIARAEAAPALLARVLETRGASSEHLGVRLAAYAEAAGVAAGPLKDPKRALDLAGKGVTLALDHAPNDVAAWLTRIDALAGAAGDPARTAGVLRAALGERAIDSEPVLHLAKRAAEAIVASGDAPAGLAIFRAALAFDPSSPELLGRVDALLRDQGSPGERLALHRGALEQPCDAARRRELLHAIASIERRDLGDAAAAIATYQRALSEDEDDAVAFEAITDIHATSGAWDALYETLENAAKHGRFGDPGAMVLRLADAALQGGRPDRAVDRYREALAGDAPIPEEVLVAIDALAVERGDTALATSAIQRRLDGATEPLDEALWLERLADVEATRLGHPEEGAQLLERAADRALAGLDAALAERLLERALALTPGRPGAAERLLSIHRDSGDVVKLARVYPLVLRAAPTPAEAVDRLAAFEPVAAKAGAQASFVEEATALLASAPDQRRAVRAMRARVLASRVETTPEAAAAYREMIEEDGDPDTIAAFEALASSRGAAAIDDRRWLYGYRLARAGEDDRPRLLFTWAQLEDHQGEVQRASDLYGKVLELEPDHDDALAALARARRSLGDLEGAAKAIAARRDHSEGDARVALELELGELLLEGLGRPDEALDSFASVLETQPSDAAAIALVVRAMGRPDVALRAAEIIEKAADAVDDAALSKQLVDLLLERSATSPELAAARRGWFERVLDRADQPPEETFAVALRALGETPADVGLWERAERLGRDLGRAGEVAQAYRRELAAWGDKDVAARPSSDEMEDVGRRAVEHLEEWFDEPEAVVVLLRQLVDLAPSSSWAFERLKLVFNLSERWDELFALYDAVIARETDDVSRAELLEDASFAAKDLAGDTVRATSYFEALLPLRRTARIQGSLERLYERQSKHRELIHLLTPDLAALSGEAAHRLRARLADLWLDGVGDPASALELAEPLLGAEAHKKDALALLERILVASSTARPAADSGPSESDRETSRRTAALLRGRYEAEGKSADLARVLEIELGASDDPEDRAKLLRKIADLRLSVLGDEPGGFAALGDLVLLAPDGEADRAALVALGVRLGEHARLGDVLASAASHTEGARRAELLAQASAIFDRDLGQLERAIDLAKGALAARGADAAGSLAAARELDRLLAAAGREVERCDVLERVASLEPDLVLRRTALVASARIALAVASDAERAVRAYREALALSPSDDVARDELAGALERAGRTEELVELLEHRAEEREGPGARADRVRVAVLLERTIADLDRAAEAWRAVRTAHGADDETADALGRLYEGGGRWGDLVELYEAEASRSTVPERTAELWRRLGDVHREHTQRWADAVACYELALEENIADGGARRGLEALAFRFDLAEPEQRPTIRAAAFALVRIARDESDDATLISLLEPRVSVAPTDADRAVVLTETARLLEARGDAAAAFDATLRALMFAASEALALETARLAAAGDRWSIVADRLGAIDALEGVTPLAMKTLGQGVSRYHEARGELDLAEGAIERALVRDARSEALLEGLAALQRRAPGRALVVTLLRLADVRSSDLDTLREAVDVAQHPLEDRALAKTLAEKLLDAAEAKWLRGDAEAPGSAVPPHFATPAEAAGWALEVLARLVQEEAPARLVDLFLRGAGLPFDAGERRRLRLRAAELADKDRTIVGGSNAPMVFDIYEHLFGENPNDALATERLEALYVAEGRRADLLVMRERQIGAAQGDKRVALRFDLASLLAEGGEAGQALVRLRENLAEAPGHAPSATKLRELLEAGAHRPELAQELAAHCEDQAERASNDGDTAAAVTLWQRAAVVAETRLGDVERAISDHRRASDFGAMPSFDALARLFAARGEHMAAAEMLDKLLAGTHGEAAKGVAMRLADALSAAGEREAARDRLARFVKGKGAPELRKRLADLHREFGAWRALADLLAEDATFATSKAERATLLAQASELYIQRCDDAAAAVPLLEQARELAPDELAPKLALSTALATSGRLDEASKVLSAIIDGYGGRRPKERALVHHYLARVSLVAGDRARALGELDMALRIDPAHPEILHALARLAFEEGQIDRADRTFRALLLVVRRPQVGVSDASRVSRAEVFLALAEIAELREDKERAAEHLTSAFEAARETPLERDRLFAALRAAKRHETLAQALRDHVEALGQEAQTPAVSADLAASLGELASLYEGPLDRQADALSARLRALGLSPDAAPVREAALDLARKLGAVERYLEVLTVAFEAATTQEKAVERLLWLGRTLELDAKDDRRAAAAYARAESEANSGGPVTFGPTSQRTSLKARRLGEIWRALERVHDRLGDRVAQAAVLEKRITASAGLSNDERADPLYRLAALRMPEAATRADALDLFERALEISADLPRAEGMLREALEEAPDDGQVVRFFERFARDFKQERALVDALVALAEGARRGAFALASGEEPLREAVDVALAQGNRELAERLLRRVLETVGEGITTSWAMVALADLVEPRDLAEAASLRERAAPHFDPGEERRLLLGVAVAAAGSLGDLDRAARLYEALRAREPADRDLWGPLAAVYRRGKDDARLASLLEETMPLVDDPRERAAMGLERAKIVAKWDEPAAASLLHDVLDDDPAQIEAAMLLSTMLERAGKTDELVALLAKQLEGAKDREDVASVVSLSLRLGALHETRDEENEALDVYHAALDWDKAAREVLRAVLRIAHARDDSMDVGDALDQLLQVEIGEAAADLALQLAQIRTSQQDMRGAESALEKGFLAAPTSARLRDELARRYTAREAWHELANLHLKDAEARTDAAEKVALFIQAGAVLRERANAAAPAAVALRRALDVDPTDRDVLMALLDAYAEDEEHDAAVAAVGVSLAVDPDDAWLYRARAGLEDARGNDAQALADLEFAYEKSGGSYATELVELLERAAAIAAEGATLDANPADGKPVDPGNRHVERGHRLRAADVLAATGDLDRARGHLGDLVKRDAKDKAALTRLADVETRAGRWDAVSATYRRLLALEDGEALVDVAQKLADACERDGRPADARGGLERALRVAPGNASVRARLAAVYEASGATRELAQMVLEDAASAGDVAGRFQHLLRAGRLLLDSDAEADLQQATAVLEQARALKPEEPETTLLLADAYAFLGRRGEARAMLERAVARHLGRRARALAPVYRRLARLDREDGQDAASFTSLVRAFENDPHSSSIAMELGAFAIERGDLEMAQRAYRTITMMKLGAPGTGEGTTQAARAIAYLQLGRIAESQGDRRKARLMAEKAAGDDPSNDEARAFLDELRGG